MPTCRWCGRIATNHRCTECGSPRLRAIVLGSERTAEELGRAFPNTSVVVSGGNKVVGSIENGPALVIATPGAEPRVNGGAYGAALLGRGHFIKPARLARHRGLPGQMGAGGHHGQATF